MSNLDLDFGKNSNKNKSANQGLKELHSKIAQNKTSNIGSSTGNTGNTANIGNNNKKSDLNALLAKLQGNNKPSGNTNNSSKIEAINQNKKADRSASPDLLKDDSAFENSKNNISNIMNRKLEKSNLSPRYKEDSVVDIGKISIKNSIDFHKEIPSHRSDEKDDIRESNFEDVPLRESIYLLRRLILLIILIFKPIPIITSTSSL